MSQLPNEEGQERVRNLHYMAMPRLWPHWPFLPLVRRRSGCKDELGLMYDARGASGLYGFSATVFLSNYFFVPAAEAEEQIAPDAGQQVITPQSRLVGDAIDQGEPCYTSRVDLWIQGKSQA